MKMFRPARPGSALRNLVKTAFQAAIFWPVFLVAGPLVLHWLEHRLGVPRLDVPGQSAAAVVVAVPMAALNLSAAWFMAVIGRGTPFPADTARELVIHGPYRHVRNPMAVGGLGLGAAVGLYLGSWLTLAHVVLGGVLWNVIARPMEEDDLAERFGEPYRAYQASVRCWIPRSSGYRASQATRSAP